MISKASAAMESLKLNRFAVLLAATKQMFQNESTHFMKTIRYVFPVCDSSMPNQSLNILQPMHGWRCPWYNVILLLTQCAASPAAFCRLSDRPAMVSPTRHCGKLTELPSQSNVSVRSAAPIDGTEGFHLGAAIRRIGMAWGNRAFVSLLNVETIANALACVYALTLGR